MRPGEERRIMGKTPEPDVRPGARGEPGEPSPSARGNWKRGKTDMKRSVFPTMLLCAALAVCALAAGCSGEKETDSPDTQPVQSGEEVAAGTASELGCLGSFSAGTLDGGSFTQEDIAAKDVTVINFWALTCGPCIVEMPDLAAFAGALPDNVQLLTVCLDGNGNEEAVREVLDGAGFEGVTLISGDGDLAALAASLMYTPTTVLVDAEGNLVGDAIIGRQEALSETYLAAVNAALAAGGKAEISLAS